MNPKFVDLIISNKQKFLKTFKKSLEWRLLLWCQSVSVENFWEAFAGSDQPMSDATKFVNIQINKALQDGFDAVGVDWIQEESPGYDYIIDSMKVEFKSTQNKKSGFHGNRYSTKVGNHLLLKFSITNPCCLTGLYLAFANINELNAQWSRPKDEITNTAHSNLKFHVDDFDGVHVMIGSLVKKRKWCYEELENCYEKSEKQDLLRGML